MQVAVHTGTTKSRNEEMRNEMGNGNKELSLTWQYFCEGSLIILLAIPLASLSIITS